MMKNNINQKNLKIFQNVIAYYCVTYGCRLKILVNFCVSWCSFASYQRIYEKAKNNWILKIKV